MGERGRRHEDGTRGMIPRNHTSDKLLLTHTHTERGVNLCINEASTMGLIAAERPSHDWAGLFMDGCLVFCVNLFLWFLHLLSSSLNIYTVVLLVYVAIIVPKKGDLDPNRSSWWKQVVEPGDGKQHLAWWQTDVWLIDGKYHWWNTETADALTVKLMVKGTDWWVNWQIYWRGSVAVEAL